MVRWATFRPTKVGLVQTRLPGTKESGLASTLEVTRGRLHPMGSAVCHAVRCGHAPDAIAKAIEATLRTGAPVVPVTGHSADAARREVVQPGIAPHGGAERERHNEC